MTIDEAYNTCFRKPYIVPIDKHEEAKSIIRELIEEVKQYREIGTVEECRNSVLDIVRAYNKALDDFAEKIKSNDRLGYVGCLDKIIDELAEQLKAGATND